MKLENTEDIKIPEIVFIVPYRNRHQHKFFFSTYVSNILKYVDNYEIYFSHQSDNRSFNRGATKNIGFLAMKEKYPNNYMDITFVFNDIDTIPYNNIFNYETEHGIVKHFYGFEYALGGIVAIKGCDFEATNGYPNFWGWGMEDNVLQKRCEKIGLTIDRSEFLPIGSPQIIHLFDGVSRLINKNDPVRATYDNDVDGIRSVHNLVYKIEKESSNPIDNIDTFESNKIFMINISSFSTAIRFENDEYYEYDIREPAHQIINPDHSKKLQIQTITSNNNLPQNNWQSIPFYPNMEKRNQMINMYGKEKAEQIIKYSYNNSRDPNTPVMPPEFLRQPQNISHANINVKGRYENKTKINLHPKYGGKLPANKFSPEYARYIGQKPRATTSANIGMGGVKRF